MAAPGSRTTLRQHPERAVPERVAEILRSGLVAHVAIATNGQPLVIPMTYHYDESEPDRLYLHGAQRSRLLTAVVSGVPVCVEVTLLDGVVYSKTALHHSMNYRSAIVVGRATPPPLLAQQRALFEAMIARYTPGRLAGRDYAPIPDNHLEATLFVAIEIEEANAKMREGDPNGAGDRDEHVAGSAGVRFLPSITG